MSQQIWAHNLVDHKDDSIRLSAVIASLWSGKRLIAAFFLLGLAAAMLCLAGFAYFKPQHEVYRTAIMLDARGSEPGHYPNGLKFAPQDLRSPAVLSAVHAAFGLEKRGISRESLERSISISEFSPAQDIVRQKYLSLLADKTVTSPDRVRLEEEFTKALESAGTPGTLVALDTTLLADASPELAKAILSGVLDHWSRIFVAEYGAANAPTSVDSKLLVKTEEITDLDYPLIYRYLDTASSRLAQRIDVMEQLPGVEGIAIASTARTVKDIARDARSLDLLQIRQNLEPMAFAGLARQPQLSAIQLQSAAQSIRDQKAETDKRMSTIDELMRQSIQTANQNIQAGGGAPAAITQFDDGTITRLLDLAVGNADRPFIRDMLNEKQELATQSIRQATLLTQLERMAAALDPATSPGVQLGADAGTRFSAIAGRTVENLNALWSELNLLAEAASSKNINQDRTLYTRIPLREEFIVTGGVQDMATWGLALGLIVIATVIGVAAHLLRSQTGQGKTSVSAGK
ncbi:MAG: hypothetical protein WCC66_05120 [Rhizobiaceae bacterium]